MGALRGAAYATVGLAAFQVALAESDRGNTRLERLIAAPGAALRAFMSADRPGIPDVAGSESGGGGLLKPPPSTSGRASADDRVDQAVLRSAMPGLAAGTTWRT